MKTYKQFIDGRYVDPSSGRWFDRKSVPRPAVSEDPAGLCRRRRPRRRGCEALDAGRAVVENDRYPARQDDAAARPPGREER